MTEQQLPEGWQMVKFGDIAKHISKRVEPSETDLEIYVGLEHLDPDSLEIKRHGVPGDVAGQKLLVKKGQIIFGKRRAYQRKVAVADWDCICSAHAMVLEANPKNVIPEFLPFFMQSDAFMSRAVAISEGSLSPTIKWKSLAIQEFPFPTIEKQKSLIQVLNKIENTINETEKLKLSSKALYEKLNDYIFGYVKSDEKYKDVSVKDLFTVDNGYAFKSEEFGKGNIPVIRISDIGVDGIVKSDNSVTVEEAPRYLKFIVKPKDILIAMSGATTGKSGVYEDRALAYLNQRVGRVVPRIESFRSSIYHLLNNKNFQRSMLVDAIGGAQPNISPTSIERTKVRVIISEQKLINVSKQLDLLSKLDAELTKKISHLKTVKTSLVVMER